MSGKMIPIPYDRLLAQVCREYEARGTIFGVSHIWHSKRKALEIFGGERLETPFGPVAGPHTQLAQSIIAAYAAGARYFELETVRAEDGGALTAPEAMEEYIKAWNVLKVIGEKYGLGSPDGFVFNMSVGHTLEGITSPKLTAYLDGMRGAGVSDSVSISTLRGCPPDEIERIANYLIGERCLHTYVKCSPTLLGYDFCRKTLDRLGYDDVPFDERRFREDLQWEDAVPMFRRLKALAKHMGVEFGVKLTDAFPAEETYLSGRALYPLTTELAARVAREFGGNLRISCSGGADASSVEALFGAGIWPVAMATELLRPGGYDRMAQLAEALYRKDYAPFSGVDTEKAAAIAANALTDERYKKPLKPVPSRKIAAQAPLLDCFVAPCREGCPIHQDIPAYVRLVGAGRHLDALRMITERNPLPHITGTLCDHRCMDKCTRQFYEGPVDIRGCKLEAATAAFDELMADVRVPERNGKRAAVIGAGPAGIAAAYFLAREGVNVTVFDKASSAGGTVRRVIPAFRIDKRAVDRDVALARAYGVNFCFGCEVKSLDELSAFDHVIVCTGAPVPGKLALEKGQARGAVEFLAAFKKHPKLTTLGRNVVVVGGGSTAVDAARAAKRVRGVKSVTIVYRRDARNMPADEAELSDALRDGVKLRTLLSPVSWEDKRLKCEIMELGPADASGRRTPVETGAYEYVDADAVLAAVGERPDAALYRALGVELDDTGRPVLDPATGRSSIPNVYFAGDGATGPSTIVEAIAGAARAAKDVCGANFEKYAPLNAARAPEEAIARKGVFRKDCGEPERCLECAAVCENCVDVCPNRANVAVDVQGRIQILHLDALCDDCGVCESFCPWSSAPYRDKWTLFPNAESFDEAENPGFVVLSGALVRARFAGEVFEVDLGEGNGRLPADLALFTRTVIMRSPELIIQ